MKERVLKILACPRCRHPLAIKDATKTGGEVEEGILQCSTCSRQYPVRNGIPRFVGNDGYASSFGHQWSKYARLQLDSYNGTTFSRDRFYAITEWKAAELNGKLVLDAGCGAGRFSETVLHAGAEVVAVDLTAAIDTCHANLQRWPDLHCIQASLYELPFRPGTFDCGFSIGVIQHTPNPRHAVGGVVSTIKAYGKVAFWIYELCWKSFVGTTGFKYLLRPLTTALDTVALEHLSAGLESLCWPVNRVARNRGTLGKLVMRFLPVCSSSLHGVPLSSHDFREWVRLDTFDMYSPAYDKPQRFATIAGWLESYGCDVDRRRPHGGISITATKR